MDSYVINKIEKKLNQLRIQSNLDYQQKMNQIYSNNPELLNLENNRRLIISDYSYTKEKKSELLCSLDFKISNYLKENNISLPIKKYNCSHCADTGYIEGKNGKERCSCFTKMLVEESTKDDCIATTKSFENFDENIFDLSIKKQILEIRDYLKKYSENFPNVKKPNTVLRGETGTGKTFLLSCIFTELKKRGFSVIFITAGKLFDILRKYALNQLEDIDALLDADMLIIDDLGTEPMFNNITIEYMFLLINERTRNNKPICVSTNLTINQIKSQYNERISSRLLDCSTTYVLSIPGKDLRL